jgi:hypothetical protein
MKIRFRNSRGCALKKLSLGEVVSVFYFFKKNIFDSKSIILIFFNNFDILILKVNKKLF